MIITEIYFAIKRQRDLPKLIIPDVRYTGYPLQVLRHASDNISTKLSFPASYIRVTAISTFYMLSHCSQRLHFKDEEIAQSHILISGEAEIQTHAKNISYVTSWQLIKRPWLP